MTCAGNWRLTDELILDASPLIFLSRVDLLNLLPQLARKLYVPAAVIQEVEAGRAIDPGAAAVAAWAVLFLTGDVEAPPSVAAWELGAGETQVIATACERRASEVVLDDLAARRCALAHGLRVVGTVGLLLRAKKGGLITAARPVLERLLGSGMFLEAALVEGVLAEVGE